MVIAGVMWFVAYNLNEDKSRAAMIGAASAFSVAGAAFLGGWFNAWRTSRLQQARERNTRKEDAYVRWLAVLADYRVACQNVIEYGNRASDTTLSTEAAGISKKKWRDALSHAGDVLLSLELASTPIEIVGSDGARRAMKIQMESVRAANPGEAIIDDATTSTFLTEVKSDLDIED